MLETSTFHKASLFQVKLNNLTKLAGQYVDLHFTESMVSKNWKQDAFNVEGRMNF
jgi:hypothetical protein